MGPVPEASMPPQEMGHQHRQEEQQHRQDQWDTTSQASQQSNTWGQGTGQSSSQQRDPWTRGTSQREGGKGSRPYENRSGGHEQRTGGTSYHGTGAGLSYGAGERRTWQERYAPLHNNPNKKDNWPIFIQPMVHDETFNSMFLIDTREATDAYPGRTLDPFNNMFPKVAAMNAIGNLKRAGPQEASNGHTTTRGAHLAVCMIQTTDTYKWTWAVTMDLDEMNSGGHWDRYLRQVMQHEAFAPMTVPRMAENSVTTVDLKLRYKKNWVSHLVLKAYQGENNMTPETLAVQEEALEMMGEDGAVDPDDIDLQLVVYKGTKVTAYAFGPGTPVLSMGPQGMVFKLSYPDVTFECRRVLKQGNLTMGMDGDRFTFMFRDHTNGLDLRGSRTSAPSDWVLISNPRGAALGTTCEAARQNGARVEGPDPIFEPAQLWTAHSRWMNQDRGDLNDPRRRDLNDLRMPNANRFEYDRHLQLENPNKNFHAAFTRGPVAMESVLTNQAGLVLPDYQVADGEEHTVNLSEVRPWGLAEPQDMVQARNPGTPSWVRGVLSEGPENVLQLSRPGYPTEFTGQYQDEEEEVLAPPPIPAGTITAAHLQEVSQADVVTVLTPEEVLARVMTPDDVVALLAATTEPASEPDTATDLLQQPAGAPVARAPEARELEV